MLKRDSGPVRPSIGSISFLQELYACWALAKKSFRPFWISELKLAIKWENISAASLRAGYCVSNYADVHILPTPCANERAGLSWSIAMHLVAGATGQVGQAVALQLKQSGRKVRAMVRGGMKHEKAVPLQTNGIEIVNADLTKPETLPPACDGIDTIVCTATSMPHGRENGLRRVDLEGVLSLIDAAESAGVRHFVYTSYSGNIRVESPLETAKRTCENRLSGSPMRTTILRPSYFMEVWLSPMLGFDPRSGRARIYGSGEAEISHISSQDVVAFAVAATLKPPSRHAVLELGGPEALSQLATVRIFEKALGCKIELDRVPLEALKEQHRSADPVQKTFAALMLAYCGGDMISGAVETAREYGVKLHSVADYARTFKNPASA